MKMKTNTFFTLIICLMLACPAWAATVSESQAREVAAQFMSTRFKANIGASPRLAHRAPAISAGKPSPYYVFNAEKANGGYVIVAGDDRVPQVLGYSDEGTFEYDNMPEAMQEWLNAYAAQIAALDQGSKTATHITTARPIAPLVKANWSQNAPYNILLPMRPNGKHALVGCVATAMAQVMHYWQWPNRPSETIPAYQSKTLHYDMPALPPTSFNWGIIQDTYYTSDTVSAAAQSAATVALYCAQSVTMDFKENTSSAYTDDICQVLPKYFGYSHDAKFLQHTYYTAEEWERIILDELAARRPVIYSAAQLSGGHAFICDGYDGHGLFHINWGWNGTSNGYFLLNVLNPDQEEPTDADETHGYILRQSIIVGLKPGTASDTKFEVYDKSIEINECVDHRTSADEDFKVTQETQLLNCEDFDIGFNFAWGLYHEGQLVQVLEPGVKDKLQSWFYTRLSRTLSLGRGITSGTYRIAPLYCELNTNNWRPCPGGNISYIEVAIDGNNCSFTCFGNNMSPDYQVNSITTRGTMHPKRPLDIIVNLTNQGRTCNDIIYMFANDKLISAQLADMPCSESQNVTFRYLPEDVGSVSITFALDQEGKQVIGNTVLTITEMPEAKLNGSIHLLNVTDNTNKIITANEIAANVTIRNMGTTTYDEDITFIIYKSTTGNMGSTAQTRSQHLTLEPRQSTTLTFHLDNVTDGWQYFAYAYYYSSSQRLTLASVGAHTIIFPSASITGDVNGDGAVNISDVNVLINMILTGDNALIGDVNGDGNVNISDVNAIINIILNGN